MGELLELRYVVIDDINFTPLWDKSYGARLQPTQKVEALVAKVWADHPSLWDYDLGSFIVLKIIKPVPPETVKHENASETAKRHGRGGSPSLAPILRRIRDRTREAKKTELANEYVKILPEYAELQNEFKREDEDLISAIVVRQTTPGESSSTASYIYPF